MVTKRTRPRKARRVTKRSIAEVTHRTGEGPVSNLLGQMDTVKRIIRKGLRNPVKTADMLIEGGKKAVKNASEIADKAGYSLEENRAEYIEKMLLHADEAIINAARAYIRKEKAEYKRKPIPQVIKDAVKERDGYCCRSCGVRNPLELHHYKQVAYGGANTTGNLITLCSNCHTLVHAKEIEIPKPRAIPKADREAALQAAEKMAVS